MSLVTLAIIRYTSVAIWTVFFILSCGITRREISIRLKHNVSTNGQLFTSKYTSLFSILSMIFSSLNPLFGLFTHCPLFCGYAILLSMNGFVSAITAFGYYQLARLYYCFSQNQSHSNKGYSNKLFFFMYLSCTISYIFHMIWPWVSLQHVRYDELCQATPKNTIWHTAAIIFVCYVWDWTVLGLYVYKICQFNKLNRTGNKEKVWKRVMFILSKITLLTLCVEILVTLNVVIVTFITVIWNEWNFVLLEISLALISGICSIVHCWVVYCMMEHNKKDYVKTLMIMEKIICFKCCKNFIRNAKLYGHSTEEKEMSDNVNAQKTKRDEIYDTNTGGLPRQISPNRVSEYTKTEHANSTKL